MEIKSNSLVRTYIITSDQGPLAIVTNKEKAEECVAKAVEKGYTPKLFEEVTNIERFKRIGNNLFKVKLPEESKADLMSFRNRLIAEYHESCRQHHVDPEDDEQERLSSIWTAVASKNGVNLTLSHFNQCVMDRIQYNA